MTERDWDLQGTRLAAFQFAEWLTINDGRARNFIEEYGADAKRAWEVAKAHGWVETVVPTKNASCRPGYVPWPYPRLTGAGELKVDEVRSLRTNQIARVAACRQAILLWLSAEGGSAPSLAVFAPSAPRFYNTPFTDDEARAAAEYLVAKGLVKGWPYPPDGLLMQPTLTARGTDCVEIYDGDVRWFYNPTRPGGGVTNNQLNNFYGDNAQAAQGENVTQTQNNVVDAVTLATIFQPMRDALPGLEDAGERRDVEHAIGELESAASDGDVEEVQQRAGRLERLVAKIGPTAGKAAITGAVSVGIKALLASLGISVG
jgi:hypothetical protein